MKEKSIVSQQSCLVKWW